MVTIYAAGVHQDTWDWYSQLFGTEFDSDSEYVPAEVSVDPAARSHWLVQGLPATFTLIDRDVDRIIKLLEKKVFLKTPCLCSLN